MIYYTAVQAGTERHMCIFRAHATSADGPFVDDFAGPLVCPERGLWAIDAYPVRDAQGDWHLLARVDESGGNNTISIRELGEFGRYFAPDSTWIEQTRITLGGWEEPVMENAGLVRLDANGEKRWYVFYSGGSYRNDTYGVGYADCGASLRAPASSRRSTSRGSRADPSSTCSGPGRRRSIATSPAR